MTLIFPDESFSPARHGVVLWEWATWATRLLWPSQPERNSQSFGLIISSANNRFLDQMTKHGSSKVSCVQRRSFKLRTGFLKMRIQPYAGVSPSSAMSYPREHQAEAPAHQISAWRITGATGRAGELHSASRSCPETLRLLRAKDNCPLPQVSFL